MSAPPNHPADSERAPAHNKGDITALIREEAARRRTTEGTNQQEERASRVPYRLIAILVLATVTLVATTKSVFQVMVFLRHPGDNAVRGVKLDEVDALVPASSLTVDDKTLIVNVGAGWTTLDHQERVRRLSELAGVLAGRYYHGARLVAADGRPVGTWAKGRIQVE